MEMLDHPGWFWGLSLIVLTVAIHATAVVMMAFAGMRIRVRLETCDLNLWNLIVILICVIGVIGLLLAVLHGIECGIWAGVYLWLGALDLPADALLFSLECTAWSASLRHQCKSFNSVVPPKVTLEVWHEHPPSNSPSAL